MSKPQSVALLAAGSILLTGVLIVGPGSGLAPFQGTQLTAGPADEPRPSHPVSTPESGALFSNPTDGYELRLPADWGEIAIPRLDGEPAVGVRRFRAPAGSFNALTISVGEPNGTVRVCDLVCRQLEGQVSLDVLEETLVSSPVPAGWRQVRRETVIGGEAARSERPNTGGVVWDGEHPAFHHFFTLHGGRPVVLSFDYWPIRRRAINAVTVQEIVDSFEFVKGDSSNDADESLALYSYPDDGYELMLPRTWEVTIPVHNAKPVRGIRRFGSWALSRGALMVSIGDPDGSIRLCAPSCIESFDLTSLDDLREALRTPLLAGPLIDSPYGPIPRNRGLMVVRGETTLGGEPARFVRPDDHGWGFGGPYHHIYGFHDGRPVVISVEYESIRRGWMSEETLSQILASFRFVD